MKILLIVLLVLAILSAGVSVWAEPGYMAPGGILGVVQIVILILLLVRLLVRWR